MRKIMEKTIMTAVLSIPAGLRKHWLICKARVFDSRYRYGAEKRIFKFSYQPETGELLFDIAPTAHNQMIAAWGRRRFEEYIRGICFWEKEVIYLRMHENDAWLTATARMLRRHGIGREIRIIWGENATLELKEDLRGL